MHFKEWVQQRYILTTLGFFLTLMGSTMTFAIGIAITEMVVTPTYNKGNTSAEDSETCTVDSTSTEEVTTNHGQFHWSEETQGIIVGSYFISYAVMQVPCGVLAERCGIRYVALFGMLLSSISYLITPVLTNLAGVYGIIAARVVAGVGNGAVFPSVSVLLSRWSPPAEKSKLGSILLVGENIGYIQAMALSGIILAHAGWPMLFYVYGCMGLVWSLFWYILGYNDPSSHPFISEAEKKYLEGCIKQVDKSKLPPTPWKSIATSLPFWGMLIAQAGRDWHIVTVVTEGPKYMKEVLHFNVQANGLLSAIPLAAMTVVAISSGWLSDFLLNKGYMTVTCLRKLFTTISAVGPAIGMLGAVYAGCDRALVIIMFTLALTFGGFFYSSLGINSIDLSPNYSGTLMGIVGYGMLSGIFAPYVAGVMATDNTMTQWRGVFWISAVIIIVTALFYDIAGSGDVQEWNQPGGIKHNRCRDSSGSTLEGRLETVDL